MKGWIKLHRTMVEWEWYADHNATRLLIHLIMTVNYERKKWKGHVIEPGSRVASWENLSKEVGLTVRQVRTAMSKLEKSGEVTRKANNKWQAITLVKWEKLQDERKTVDRQEVTPLTNRRQTEGNQMSTTKESKNNKKDKKGNKEEKAVGISNENHSILSFTDDQQFIDAWNEWNQVRKSKKCAFTDRATKQHLNSLNELAGDNVETAVLILNQSADSGWTKLYPLKNTTNAKNTVTEDRTTKNRRDSDASTARIMAKVHEQLQPDQANGFEDVPEEQQPPENN